MDMHCKDKSGRCMTISVNSCKMPILAEVCKRSCGLCNGGQLQVLPPFPFHLQGKPLHTTLLCCDLNNVLFGIANIYYIALFYFHRMFGERQM